jgi:hypothetical protein
MRILRSMALCTVFTYPNTVMYNSMEHSHSLETTSRSSSQEVLLLLWNPKVHYNFQESPFL